MHSLYPPINPYATHRLVVDGPHNLYVEECGKPKGLPVLFLHGGPGSGCEPVHRRFFDPEIYRVILFDQRGSGRSTPHAALEGNTTWDLVADIERLREFLGIESWVVFGGSWGSTLGLAYAETHPERVRGLILRGIFLCRPEEIRWFYQGGTARLFPDYWEDFLEPIPEAERHDMVGAYYRRLTGPDEVERLRVARAWSVWEGSTLTLQPQEVHIHNFAEAHKALSLARIECHYFKHDSFLEPDQLLRNAYKLEGIPGHIVHGRYDVICPLDNAWALDKAWPGAKLTIVPDAGHAATEPGIIDALVGATRDLGARLA